MRLFKVTVAGKLPIENFSLPVVSACPSWHFQASPLGVQESVLLDCSFSTQHSSVDTESPRDKGIGVFQFSHGSQRSPLKAVAVPRLMDWAFYKPTDSSNGSAPQPEKERMLALLAVQGIIFVIKIQNVFFRLKSKLLVEQHSRVACRDVKSYIFAHAGLPREGGKKKSITAREWDGPWGNVEVKRFIRSGIRVTEVM